ncbi:acetoin ABC transporter permease [Bacillus cereus]|uniref:ABC transporter permease subunit n=1 Tax=Bacillus paramycoides TaxID=2026194 RepID=UPI000BFA3142|nr:ABC transporter permease subunit [Bacillus paramycoides]PFD45901.1 acetoin ABC transporter permease [Bacillus cereus]PGM62567.1 acetoin ABC transporter permease [Bacillus cereus]
MFHKALWIRTYQQSKYIVWLFWLVSFYVLSYKYYLSAATQLHFFHENSKWNYIFRYTYHLSLIDAIMVQGALLIALACILIGWERQNQSSDFLWSMPFKRKDLFMTKWLFGVCNIVAIVILNWGIFAIMKKTTFHNKYQVFSPFHTYFLYMVIVLISIYTLALCIGTITGNIISQGFFATAILGFPFILPTLIAGFISIHTNTPAYTQEKVDSLYTGILEKVNILAPIHRFDIDFDYDPQRAYTDAAGVRHDEPNFTYIPSATKLIGPIANIIILLPLGMYLYTRSPNEQNGNFLLYPNLKKLCMICCVIFIGMFGGMLVGGSHSIWSYYMGFIGTSVVVYLILSRFLKLKFSSNIK